MRPSPVRLRRIAVALAGLPLVGGAALAQSVPPPVGANIQDLPAATGQSTTAPLPSGPRIDKPAATNPQDLLNKVVTPTQFQIRGSKAIDFSLLSNHFAPLAGKPTTVAALVAKANEVAGIYRDKGFALSYAVLPTQDFADGIVQVQVVEGFIDKIIIEGDVGGSEARIREVAQAAVGEKPLTSATFERISGILSRMPSMGLKASASFPKVASGATPLTITANRRPLTGNASLESREDGLRSIVNVGLHGYTPLAESVTFTTLIPLGETQDRFYGVNGSIPLGGSGLRLGVFASIFESMPANNSLTNVGFQRDYISESDRAGVSLSYPLLLTRQETLDGSLRAYGGRNEEIYFTSANNAQLSIGTVTRVLAGDLNHAVTTGGGVRRLGLTVAKGLNVLDAERSNSNAELAFFRMRATASQSFTLSPKLGASISGVVQTSPDELPSTERISFGGRFFGAGYKAGDLSGDQGYGIAAELNTSFALPFQYITDIKPYLLADAARAFSNGANLIRSDIASVGAGVRVADRKYYNIDISVALPVGDTPSDNADRVPRLNANYSLNF